MKIRTQPPDHSNVEPCHTQEVITFYGGCHAVRLHYRGINDHHICWEILTEDDGNWFLSKEGASSSWLPELIELLTKAEKWMYEHAKPDIYNNIQYGYKL